jgi:type IV pilus assembly protein PilA
MKHYLPAERRGFTLIELLVVIGILAVLLAITLIAINPARQFSQANNTKRASDVNAILNAVGQYMADNRGALPVGITTGVLNVSDTGANICASLMTQYLAALPVDPLTNAGAPVTNCTAAYNTGYTIVRSGADNRITVAAPLVELGATISVTR